MTRLAGIVSRVIRLARKVGIVIRLAGIYGIVTRLAEIVGIVTIGCATNQSCCITIRGKREAKNEWS